MPATSVQFTVEAHIMALLGSFRDKEISSAAVAASVNADPHIREEVAFETLQRWSGRHYSR